MKHLATYTAEEAILTMNRLGKARTPFLFIVDYKMKAIIIKPLPLHGHDILFDIKGFKHTGEPKIWEKPVLFTHQPVPFSRYRAAFEEVMEAIKKGNSYLVNLTQPSGLDTNLTPEAIFYHSNAPYKLFVRDRFVVFSPETFVTIRDGIISCHPMKGTIDATLPNAKKTLQDDPKEKAEHMTIVDLIRNDLSIFATQVHVKRLRYLELITTNNRNLWQMSSEISGCLPGGYHEKIGNILFSLLPAGSVTGAPKRQTLNIIEAAEKYDRGYYTGVFGYFDGQNLDSGVMIRFIEQQNDKLVYKSGGGITAKSNIEKEYAELKHKIYVPFH